MIEPNIYWTAAISIGSAFGGVWFAGFLKSRKVGEERRVYDRRDCDRYKNGYKELYKWCVDYQRRVMVIEELRVSKDVGYTAMLTDLLSEKIPQLEAIDPDAGPCP